MTLSRTFGSLRQHEASKSGAVLFNNLGIYHFCIAFFIIDSLDVFDLLDYSRISDLIKYGYAAILIGFMIVYFLRWKAVDTTVAPIIFLLFFVATGLVFAINFFLYDERESYISAFIASLVFSLAIFIPSNSIMLNSGKITRALTLLFSIGAIFYLAEAAIRPLFQQEVQLLKSMNCVLALCLSILTGRKTLALFIAVVTAAALALRPTSTLVLALICCLPIAVALRPRVLYPRTVGVLLSRAVAMTTLLLAIGVPLLLYFFFDDIAPIIEFWEGYFKNDVVGGQSNVAFRLAILKFAFTAFDNTSFWYGSALSGSHTVLLALVPGWNWWWEVKGTGAATIYSDFVVVLILTGILGYAVFSIAFYLVLKDRFRELTRRDLRGNSVVLQSISIIGLVALLVYCSAEPYLSYYNHTHTVWMLLLISEVARRSRVIGNPQREVVNRLFRSTVDPLR